MSKRIAHITPVYPPYAGGIGVVAKNMAEGLAARGWQVEVVMPKGSVGDIESQGHKVIALHPFIKIGNAAVVPQLRKLGGYDIIHLHYPFFGGAEWLLCNTLINNKSMKFVLQFHHDADARSLKGIIFELYDKIILPRLIRRADRVIVSSSDYARHARTVKYISDKFVEIPFGVDAKRFEPLSSHFERSEESPTNVGSHPREILPTNAIGGQNDKTMRMLFVGSLDRAHWFKGLEVLLRAFVILKQEKEQNHLNSVHLNPALNTTIAANPACAGSPARAGRRLGLNLKCLVVGEGDLKEKYIKMAQELGIQDHVQFLGNVPHAQLPDYYRNADLFVFPSVSRAEAFGLVVLEAMASGLPVIVSNLPGVRTLVEEGVNGFKVPVNDPQTLAQRIRELMEDKSLCSNMGQKSREKVLESYAWDKAISRIERVYQDIL